MSIAIIDARESRRVAMRDWLTAEGQLVRDSSVRNGVGNPTAFDLLLLHVSEYQRHEEQAGDLEDIILENIIAEFCEHAWVLGYSGDPVNIAEFKRFPGEEFAVFPDPVDANTLDEKLKKVLSKVIRELPSRKVLPRTWFKETVTGFDPALEQKLEALSRALSNQGPSSKCLEVTGAEPPSDSADLSDPSSSIASLRDRFLKKEAR